MLQRLADPARLASWLIFGAVLLLPINLKILIADAAAWQLGFFSPVSAVFLFAFQLPLLAGLALFFFSHFQLRPISNSLASMLACLLAGFSVPVFFAPEPVVAILLLLAIAAYSLLAVAASQLDSRLIFWASIAAGFVSAALALAQFAANSSLGLGFLGEPGLHPAALNIPKIELAGAPWIRPAGLTEHANILAGFLAVALAAAFAVNWNRRWLGFAVLFVLAAGLAVSFSRAGWLAGGAGLILVLLISGRRIFSNLIPVLLAAGVFVAAFWPAISARIESPSSHGALLSRAEQIEFAAELAIQNPAGLGIGGFESELKKQNPDLPGYAVQPVHHSVLKLAADSGWLAAAAWLGALLAGLIFAIRNRAAGAAGGLAAILVASQFDHAFVTQPGLLALFFVLLGLAANPVDFDLAQKT